MELPTIEFDNPGYNELKTELQICKIGGLFLALYKDKRIIKLIINYLKHDLPEQFIFSLRMNSQKIGFPTFFDQTFEQTGKQNNIFHVIGIDQLPEELQKNFINYLEYTRERFKAKPYSIIFWVTPQFERQLFFAAPDFYHWISGIYDFSELEINKELWEEADISESRQVSLENITTCLEKMVWQYEHWEEVKKRKEKFLIEVMERANLHEYYVPTYCIEQNGKINLLDNVLKDFLANKTKYFFTLLGDFGTGKTSFALHYFILLAKKYLQHSNGRIPIFISLKDLPKKINIEDFIVREFYEKYNIKISFNVFQELALKGKFIFFLDGFDEMASSSDQKLTEENFKELTKLTFENILFMTTSCSPPKKANKIFLTCRTHYFLSDIQEKMLLRYTVLYRDYVMRTPYEITKIKLKEFNDEQIAEYISKITKNVRSTKNILDIIKDTYNLKELSTQPILLEMIVKTLSSLKNKRVRGIADLYKFYTDMWINTDDWRSRMKPEGKRRFMWELAHKMFENKGGFSLHYSKLNPPKKEYLKQDFQNLQGNDDYYKYETTTCSFLNRDPEGNYKFIHKSFMEYFIAEYYFSTLFSKRLFSPNTLNENKEVLFFLKLIISSKKKELTKCDLSRLDLSGVDLEDACLESANLQGATLIKANLREADLRKAHLGWTKLNNADLRDAKLSMANFISADLTNADLRGANLQGITLSSAKLEGTSIYKSALNTIPYDTTIDRTIANIIEEEQEKQN